MTNRKDIIVKKDWIKTLVTDTKRHSSDSKGRAEDILRLLLSRDEERLSVPIWERGEGIWRPQELDTVDNKPMTAGTWQTFKRDFIEEYGGEPVKETGMTDSEFFDWFKTGKRELESGKKSLKELISELPGKTICKFPSIPKLSSKT